MAVPLPPSDFERGMACGRLSAATGQAQHHLAGIGAAVFTIVSASSAGATPTPGLPSRADLAAALRDLADRLDAPVVTPATADALEAA